ncbi:MAG: CarD family transcriptional regulator, partial [Prosthecobacter sp.]|nr:CarD family transcriptional regulator [Prosthecobacter sp.]
MEKVATVPNRGARKKPAPKSRLPHHLAGRQRGETHALVQDVLKRPEFSGKLAALGTPQTLVLDHITPEATAFAVALVAAQRDYAHSGRRLWVLCPDVRIQDRVHAELLVWQCPALYFPRQIQAPGVDALQDPETLAERISILSRWREGGPDNPSVLVLCVDSLTEGAPALTEMESQRRTLQVGAKLDVEAFLADLSAAGYERVPVVTERGQFARRGGIVDFFSWQAEEPLRLEFFDDELESIRAFDLHNQASVRRLERAGVILQLRDAPEDDTTNTVRDHLGQDDLLLAVGCDPDLHCHARILPDASAAAGIEDYATAIHENPLGVFDASDFVLHEARRKQFDRQLDEWQAQGWKTVIFFHNEAEKERFAELRGADPSGDIETTLGLLYRGFTVPAAKLAVLTGAEIFGRHQTHRRVRGSKLDEAENLRKARDVLRELREGDLVVHSDHGIARYAGIEQRTAGGKKEEVLILLYADEAKLFVPVAQAHMVTRYVGVGGKAPALSKLGGASWQKTRKGAEKSVEEFAGRMLSITAERQTILGYAHPPDTKWQLEFEESFLYRETPDQLRCTEEIKRDMEGEKPMDRL